MASFWIWMQQGAEAHCNTAWSWRGMPGIHICMSAQIGRLPVHLGMKMLESVCCLEDQGDMEHLLLESVAWIFQQRPRLFNKLLAWFIAHILTVTRRSSSLVCWHYCIHLQVVGSLIFEVYWSRYPSDKESHWYGCHLISSSDLLGKVKSEQLDNEVTCLAKRAIHAVWRDQSFVTGNCSALGCWGQSIFFAPQQGITGLKGTFTGFMCLRHQYAQWDWGNWVKIMCCKSVVVGNEMLVHWSDFQTQILWKQRWAPGSGQVHHGSEVGCGIRVGTRGKESFGG